MSYKIGLKGKVNTLRGNLGIQLHKFNLIVFK